MASRTNNGLARICNYICVVLMLVILVFQFLPFWHYSTEEESFATSIQTYIWFPGECRDLDDYLAEQTGNEDIEAGQILGMPILVLVSGAVGIVLCLIKAKSAIVSLLPAICGISGIWGFLSTPAFQLGSNWVVSLVLCIAVLLVSLVSLLTLAKKEKAQNSIKNWREPCGSRQFFMHKPSKQ